MFKNEKNIGPVLNWQKCVEYSTGEYIKILWYDDLIDKRFIEKTLPYLIENKDIGFVFTGTEIFNEKQEIKPILSVKQEFMIVLFLYMGLYWEEIFQYHMEMRYLEKSI